MEFQEPPGSKGVYGLLFIPRERRLEPNVNKVAQKIIHNYIRENIPPLDEKKHAQIKNAAKRYSVGPDAAVVHAQTNAERGLDRMNDAKSKTHFGSTNLVDNSKSEYDPLERPKRELQEYKNSLKNKIDEHEKNRKTKINQAPRLSVSAHMAERIEGGRYHVEKVQDPWMPRFEMQSSQSYFPVPNSTPKLWPADAQYTYNEKARAGYHPDYSEKLALNTWAKPQHSKTLKQKLREQGLETVNPALSANVCSKNRFRSHHNNNYENSVHSHEDSFGDWGDEITNANSNQIGTPNKYYLDTNDSLAGGDSFFTNVSFNTDLMPSLKPQKAASMSTLQQTLVDCGKVAKSKDLSLIAAKEKIEKSNKNQKKMLKSHAKFLKHKISGQIVEDDSIATNFFMDDDDDHRIRNISILENKPVKVSNSTINNDKIKNLNNESVSNDSFKSHDASYKTALGEGSYKRYSQKLSEHLQVFNTNASLNPYRQSGQVTTLTNFSMKEGNKLDPKTYRHQSHNYSHGNFNITIKSDAADLKGPSKGDLRRAKAVIFSAPSELPARSEINSILSQIEKKSLISYDTRIVETGALIKALQAPMHMSPGFPAVIQLHRALIDAAAVNPNSWTLNRLQISEVIQRLLPWFPAEPLKRLLAAYDENNSGIYRFIKITSACLCACRPAMSDLIMTLKKAQERKENQKIKAEKLKKMKANKNAGYVDDDDASENESSKDDPVPKHIQNDIFILSMVHGLYEDCDGGFNANVNKQDVTAAAGVGMRLSDIQEALSVCSCSIDDEIRMNEVSEEFIQYLFDLGQKDDIIHYNNPTSYLNIKEDKIKEKSIYPNCSIADFDSVSKLSMESRQLEDNENSTVIPGGDSLAWGSRLSKAGSPGRIENRFGMSNVGTVGGNISGGNNLNTKRSKLESLRPNALHVMKHSLLKDLRHIPRISQSLLMDSIVKFPVLMEEFSKQLNKFRGLVKPYTIGGSISYEDSVLEKFSYGTRHGSNQSLHRREF